MSHSWICQPFPQYDVYMNILQFNFFNNYEPLNFISKNWQNACVINDYNIISAYIDELYYIIIYTMSSINANYKVLQ